eukprot:gb/GEZN01013970.1/.p1 GENE.gb/GEZN01013970.1/~~gb/GEZN01013970.1/.p1  ORF type:complete len:102 (+),score=12.64 gb/GEZN01013970.1/:389-694(+)
MLVKKVGIRLMSSQSPCSHPKFSPYRCEDVCRVKHILRVKKNQEEKEQKKKAVKKKDSLSRRRMLGFLCLFPSFLFASPLFKLVPFASQATIGKSLNLPRL